VLWHKSKEDVSNIQALLPPRRRRRHRQEEGDQLRAIAKQMTNEEIKERPTARQALQLLQSHQHQQQEQQNDPQPKQAPARKKRKSKPSPSSSGKSSAVSPPRRIHPHHQVLQRIDNIMAV
jgi:hypothetical protein